jgi:hypothetical protein
MRFGGDASLPLQRDIDEQRHSELTPLQAIRQPLPRGGHLTHLDLAHQRRLLEHLTPQHLAPSEGEDLSVGQIGERFDGRHSSDELAEDDEVLGVARGELVDEVLEEDPEGGGHVFPAFVELAGEGGEAC